MPRLPHAPPPEPPTGMQLHHEALRAVYKFYEGRMSFDAACYVVGSYMPPFDSAALGANSVASRVFDEVMDFLCENTLADPLTADSFAIESAPLGVDEPSEIPPDGT